MVPSLAALRGRPDNGVYTRSEIAALYRQHQKGIYAGREETWSAIERDIIDAGRTGRILGADTIGK